MIAWITENIVAVIALAVILLAVGAAVFVLVKDKKSKKGVCTGNCAACGMNCSYHEKQ